MSSRVIPTLAVLITCHNRRETTQRCLLSLLKQEGLHSSFLLNLFLTDDGCSDGTAEMVRQLWSGAHIVTGDGTLYWNQGMRRAWLAAAAEDPDYYFLVNDDTVFCPDAAHHLLNITGTPECRRIGVALIADPATGRPAYGGITRDGKRVLPPAGSAQPAQTFNANGALVPRAVFKELGVFHDKYQHSMGDYDYGFQARRRGIEIWVSGKVLGTCSPNSALGTWRDRSLPLKERFRKLQAPKGLPWAQWLEFNRRNHPWTWPWRTLSPYIRVALGL